ncbi:MAG: patatin family protein [Acutalibacter sp.]|nr:patatin family protein [Acutalibacter sp.]
MSKKAVVLEGGALRCLFTAGVMDTFLKEGMTADGLFGVSAGALTGTDAVANQPGRTAKVNLGFVNDKRYLGVGNLLRRKGIFNFDFLFGEVCDTLVPFDREAFFSSPMEFTAVATNCLTGEPVYCEKNHCEDIYAAIRASASMPLLSPMVQVEGVPCLDGGVSVSIPYQKAIDEGYDKILVVTTREHGYRKSPVPRSAAKLYARFYRKYPALVRGILNVPRRYGKELDEIDKLEAAGKIFVIRPPKPVDVSRTEKDVEKLQALYDGGCETFRQKLEAFRRYWEEED